MVVKPKKGQKILCNGSKQVYKIVWKLIKTMQPFDRDKEHFFVIGTNRAYCMRYIDHVSTGTMHGTIAEPREVFRNAIYLGASCIILAHNHPSGSLIPSQMDIKVTEELMKAGKLLRIEVIDHIIVSSEGYYSFSDEGKLK
jgi:DNA repair protein RadC